MLEISKKGIEFSKQELKTFCLENHIISLSLFGSVLREDFSNNSDIDILVEFDKNYIPSLFEIVSMEKQLGKIFRNRKIDLRTLNDLSKYFRNEVKEGAVQIYAI